MSAFRALRDRDLLLASWSLHQTFLPIDTTVHGGRRRGSPRHTSTRRRTVSPSLPSQLGDRERNDPKKIERDSGQTGRGAPSVESAGPFRHPRADAELPPCILSESPLLHHLCVPDERMGAGPLSRSILMESTAPLVRFIYSWREARKRETYIPLSLPHRYKGDS